MILKPRNGEEIFVPNGDRGRRIVVLSLLLLVFSRGVSLGSILLTDIGGIAIARDVMREGIKENSENKTSDSLKEGLAEARMLITLASEIDAANSQTSAHRWAGFAFYRARDYDRAISIWRSIVNVHTEDQITWYRLGQAYRAVGGSFVPMVDAWRNAGATRSLRELGDEAALSMQWKDSLIAYGSVLKLRPSDASANYQYAKILMDSFQDYSQASSYLGVVIQNEPGMLAAYLRLGYAQRQMGDYQSAGATYLLGLRALPNSSELFVALGDLNYDLGRIDQAGRYYGEARRLDPVDSAPHGRVARVLRARGDLAGALNEYRLAIELNPADTTTRNKLGDLLVELGEYDLAIQEFAAVIQIDHDNHYAAAMLHDLSNRKH